MPRNVTKGYECEWCSETHDASKDENGRLLAFCPKRGTVLVE